MQTRVVVVTLDIIQDDYDYDEYLALPSMQKLAGLIDRLHFVCAVLQINEPDAKWLAVWPEHGITNAEKFCLNAEEKKVFKKAMQDVTEVYPQLTIIAGTVPTVREVPRMSTRYGERKKREKMGEISVAYRQHAWVKDVEIQEDIGGWYAEYEKLFLRNFKLETNAVIRNTAYVFMGGKCIARHDKMTPYKELDRYPVEYGLFQVAKGRSVSSHITIVYPDGVCIPVCIEICREHGVGVAKREYDLMQKERPAIHFVLSDAVPLFEYNVIGEYLMHADTRCVSELQQMHDSEYSIVHYGMSLTRKASAFTGPNEVIDKRDARHPSAFNPFAH